MTKIFINCTLFLFLIATAVITESKYIGSNSIQKKDGAALLFQKPASPKTSDSILITALLVVKVDTIPSEKDESSREPDISNKVEDESTENPHISNKVEDESSREPDISNKVEDGSTENPHISNKVEDESTENPHISNKVEDESTEKPDMSNKKVEDESTEEPNSSVEVKDESNEEPDSSVEVKDESNEEPDSSDEVKDETSEEPDNSDEEEDESTEKPDSSDEEDESAEKPDSSDEVEDLTKEKRGCSQKRSSSVKTQQPGFIYFDKIKELIRRQKEFNIRQQNNNKMMKDAQKIASRGEETRDLKETSSDQDSKDDMQYNMALRRAMDNPLSKDFLANLLAKAQVKVPTDIAVPLKPASPSPVIAPRSTFDSPSSLNKDFSSSLLKNAEVKGLEDIHRNHRHIGPLTVTPVLFPRFNYFLSG